MRLVRFIDPEDSALGNREMLEIETKRGRFWHLEPLEGGSSIALHPGPARPQGSNPGAVGRLRRGRRSWRDLSETLPGAFDGRPTVLRLEPIGRAPGAEPEEAASAWILHLSTGYRVTCRPAGGDGLELTGAYRE